MMVIVRTSECTTSSNGLQSDTMGELGFSKYLFFIKQKCKRIRIFQKTLRRFLDDMLAC